MSRGFEDIRGKFSHNFEDLRTVQDNQRSELDVEDISESSRDRRKENDQVRCQSERASGIS